MNDDSDSRDFELDELLRPLRQPQSTELQLARWKKAALAAARPSARHASWKTSVAAALVAGFVVGALSVYLTLRWREPSQFEVVQSSATTEIVFVKAE